MKKRIGVFIILLMFIASPNTFAEKKNHKKKCDTNSVNKFIKKLLNQKAKSPVPVLSMNDCICIALKKNELQEISKLNISIAESQYKQALSSYWPDLKLNFAASLMEEDLNFIFPSEVSEYSISGLGPAPINATVAIPEKDIKVMNKELYTSALELSIPLYTGGIRSALSTQAKLGIEAAKQSTHRMEQKLIFDVKKMYYATILAKELIKAGSLALGRLKGTLTLTEHLYKKGASSVNKTDFLKTKVMVESVESILTDWEATKMIAKSALAHTMGLSWDTTFKLMDKSIPFRAISGSSASMLKDAMRYNPDWKRLMTAIKIGEAKIKEEIAGYMPKVLLSGAAWDMHSDFESGIETDENTQGWKVELGMHLPVFQGFLTKNKVGEAKIRHHQLLKQKRMLKNGLALQINQAFMKLKQLKKQTASSFKALNTATSNRKLNIKAYETGMATTKDVLESQLMESFMDVRYKKTLYDYAETGFHLDFLVGKKDQIINNPDNEHY